MPNDLINKLVELKKSGSKLAFSKNMIEKFANEVEDIKNKLKEAMN